MGWISLNLFHLCKHTLNSISLKQPLWRPVRTSAGCLLTLWSPMNWEQAHCLEPEDHFQRWWPLLHNKDILIDDICLFFFFVLLSWTWLIFKFSIIFIIIRSGYSSLSFYSWQFLYVPLSGVFYLEGLANDHLNWWWVAVVYLKF